MIGYDNGLTTIEKAREEFNQSYNGCHWLTKVELKCWLNHAESRNRNGNKPFTFMNYINHMDERLYLEQVELDMIDCADIGGKEEIKQRLRARIGR